MGPEKEEIPKTSRQQSRMVPRCPAYVGLCEAFAAGVRKQPLAPILAPVGPFLWDVGEGRILSGQCGSSRTR